MNLLQSTVVEYLKNGTWYRARVINVGKENIKLEVFASQPTNAWRHFNDPYVEVISMESVNTLIVIEKEMA